jgi:hypothetical protein
LKLYRGRTALQTTYNYGNYTLSTVEEQRDLGVLIDKKLNFRNHTDLIVSKAASSLAFVKRFCHDINDLSGPFQGLSIATKQLVE